MLAPTTFAHQVNIRLQQSCVVLVGVYPATPVVCWRFRCFLPRSLLGTTGNMAQSPPGLGVGVLWCHIHVVMVFASAGGKPFVLPFFHPFGSWSDNARCCSSCGWPSRPRSACFGPWSKRARSGRFGCRVDIGSWLE